MILSIILFSISNLTLRNGAGFRARFREFFSSRPETPLGA